jgi:hypothetical protein
MDEQNVVYPYNGILFSYKRNEILMLQYGEILKTGERSQTQNTTYCMIPFISSVQNREIHKDKGILVGAGGWRNRMGSDC